MNSLLTPPPCEICRRVACEGTHAIFPTLAEVEDDYIRHVLRMSNGNISLAARRLGVYRSTLKRRLRKMD